MTTEPSVRQGRLSAALTVGLAVTFLLGVLLNLAQAIVGDEGWPSRQPLVGVRVAVGARFLVFALGRLVLWLAGRLATRRPRA
ncbi:hypothetical protein [Microlunatus sagamiharensis]|nr:hypothetical protein [Microlunatus sagamiharensis]